MSPPVAIVTGGGSGIGRACATRFAERGYRTIVGDISIEEGADVERVLRERGFAVAFVRADVADEADCDNLAATALDAWGRIDVLVANAGIQIEAGLAETTTEQWDAILGVNLKGVAYSCKAVLPAMVRQRSGSIVIVSSLNAATGSRRMPVYDASKAAVVGLMRSLAIANGRDGIRVNAIGPGATVTKFHLRRAAEAGISPDELRQRTSTYGLLGRAAEPEEIAAVVDFLAGSDASNITGQFLLVDGGASLAGALA